LQGRDWKSLLVWVLVLQIRTCLSHVSRLQLLQLLLGAD
jgi:hypothetical protein